MKQKEPMDDFDYRKEHPSCRYCEYGTQDKPHEYVFCVLKRKYTYFPKLNAKFCKCYIADRTLKGY